jgi:purine-binding chemotaxis protein CheW
MAGGFDWREVHERLERTGRVLDAGGIRSPEEIKRILQERARTLAKPVTEAPAPTELLDLLVFSVSGERFGVKAEHVVEVIPLEGLTPVPCTPPFVVGVVNHRGRIFPVLDLRRLLDLPGQGVAEGKRIVAVDAAGMTFGIAAETVVGTVQIAVSGLAPSPTALAGARGAFLTGVTGDMVAVLDLEAVARDPRIVVNEEIG